MQCGGAGKPGRRQSLLTGLCTSICPSSLSDCVGGADSDEYCCHWLSTDSGASARVGLLLPPSTARKRSMAAAAGTGAPRHASAPSHRLSAGAGAVTAIPNAAFSCLSHRQ